MFNKRLFSLVLTAGLILGLAGLAMAGVPDPGASTVYTSGGEATLTPGGLAQSLAIYGVSVTVTVRDGNGLAIPRFRPRISGWMTLVMPTSICASPVARPTRRPMVMDLPRSPASWPVVVGRSPVCPSTSAALPSLAEWAPVLASTSTARISPATGSWTWATSVFSSLMFFRQVTHSDPTTPMTGLSTSVTSVFSRLGSVTRVPE